MRTVHVDSYSICLFGEDNAIHWQVKTVITAQLLLGKFPILTEFLEPANQESCLHLVRSGPPLNFLVLFEYEDAALCNTAHQWGTVVLHIEKAASVSLCRHMVACHLGRQLLVTFTEGEKNWPQIVAEKIISWIKADQQERDLRSHGP